MIAYASRTGTRRNLDALRAAGWRLMVSARGVLRAEGFRYALDNGAWTARQEFERGERSTPIPDLLAFECAVDKMGAAANFIVVPDIVLGGGASWMLSRAYLRRLRRDRRLRGARLLIAVQDGFAFDMLAPFLSARVGVFVGGSTEWKLATLRDWQALAARCGSYCHVGRVNSAKRARLCDIAGVDSFDGSGPSRYAQHLRQVEQAFEQRDLEGLMRRG